MENLFEKSDRVVVDLDAVQMDVDKIDDEYMWLLQINSNKFRISFRIDHTSISDFQIFSGRWYFEMTLPIIKTIRNIAQNMYTHSLT